MGAGNRTIVVFEDVSASVGGIDISSIIELQLTACANGIPSITLMVDAGHSEGADAPVASDKVSLADAAGLYSSCQAMVKTSGATLSLSLTAREIGSGGAQTLSISGWMLTDVALSPIREGGVCGVSLTFMHPICKAHFGGAVPGLLVTEPDWSRVQGSNPLAVYISALGVYGASAQRAKIGGQMAGMANQAQVRSALLKKLAAATSALQSALAWHGGGLPAGSKIRAWEKFIRMGLAYYAIPSEGSSVLGRFLSGVVPECSLSIGGDYTSGKLDVGPFAPWAAPSMSISDSDIIEMQFPSRDPSPLAGVRVESIDTSNTVPTSMTTVESAQIEPVRSDNYYIPSGMLDAEFLYGPIQQFSEPGWLNRARGHAENAADTARSNIMSATNGNFQDPRTTGRGGSVAVASAGASIPQASYNAALVACAKAYCETSLMKDWEFAVTTRFMVRSGGILCPGRVISVNSSGGPVLSGYVTSVTHTISVPQREASTEIVCSHPRSGDPPFGVGTANALY